MADEELSLIDANLTEEELAALEDDDDDLEQLTLDELAAEINKDDGPEEIIASDKEKGKGEGDDDDEGDDDQKAKPDANQSDDDNEPAKDEGQNKAEEANAGEGDDDADDDLNDVDALPKSLDLTDANERLRKNAEQIDRLEAQALKIAEDEDDGELTAVEARIKRREIDKQINKLNDENTEIRIDAKLRQDNAKDNWFDNVVPTFLDQNPIYSDNKAMAQVFDNTVRELQTQVIAAGKNPLSPSILLKAHKMIKAQMPGMFAAATPKADPSPKDEPKAKAPEKGRERVPTLSDVPSASDNIGTNTKFAALDKLDGEEYERAFEKLSDAEQEEYLSQ